MIEDGILLIDKPSGMTSFGVVARVRRVLSEHYGRKIKVGHTGTLDPFATGLMIIVVGKECKNAMKYSKLDKVYEATIQLGHVSTTGDPEGDVVAVSDTVPTTDAILRALDTCKGESMQRPPIYSAIKINGERAYRLARAGVAVEIPERQITIYSLDLIRYAYPELTIRTHVSSGTYIRTLAEDIGKVLQTGAYCLELRRIAIADWHIEDALQLTEFGVSD